MKKNVILMFPQSVYVSEHKHEVTENEFDYIRDLPTRNNGPANSVTLSDQVLEAEQLKNIKDFCQKNIEQYAYEVLCIKKDIEFYITQSWANYSKKGQFHPQHRHNNSIISAVFYVNQVKDSPIRFFKEENSLLSQAWVMEPKKKVQDIVKELSIADLKIKEFYRIKIGE